MLTIQDKVAFVNLASRLSPENLHCDGEISRSEAQRKYTVIIREWKLLEKRTGVKVDEDEPWNWIDEVMAYERGTFKK